MKSEGTVVGQSRTLISVTVDNTSPDMITGLHSIRTIKNAF